MELEGPTLSHYFKLGVKTCEKLMLLSYAVQGIFTQAEAVPPTQDSHELG